MIIWSNHVIFLPKQLGYLKCELWEVESPQNHLWLIFNNCSKAEKSLPCLFYHFISITDLGLNPVALDRVFDELSKNIKFVEIGSVDLDLLNFEFVTRLQFKWKRNKPVWISNAGGKRNGPAQLRWRCERAAWQWGSTVSSFKTPNR